MFGSPVLEVVAGLTALYVSMSLVCSALGEWLAASLRWRSKFLSLGIRSLLHGARDHEGRDFAERLFASPLVTGLMAPHRGSGPAQAAVLPCYLAPRTFTETLLTLLRPGDWQGGAATFNDMMRMIERLPDSQLKVALLTLGRASAHDPDRFRQNIDSWYNQAMDRVTGCYKRRMTLTSILLAAGLCLALRVDTLEMIGNFWADAQQRAEPAPGVGSPPPRAAARDLDEGPVDPPSPPPATLDAPRAPALSDIEPSPPPVSSPDDPRPGTDPSETSSRSSQPQPRNADRLLRLLFGPGGLEWALTRVLGLILSTIAVAMGAPFWFDLLNRVSNVRLAGPPISIPRPPHRTPRPSEPSTGAGHGRYLASGRSGPSPSPSPDKRPSPSAEL